MLFCFGSPSRLIHLVFWKSGKGASVTWGRLSDGGVVDDEERGALPQGSWWGGGAGPAGPGGPLYGSGFCSEGTGDPWWGFELKSDTLRITLQKHRSLRINCSEKRKKAKLIIFKYLLKVSVLLHVGWLPGVWRREGATPPGISNDPLFLGGPA